MIQKMQIGVREDLFKVLQEWAWDELRGTREQAEWVLQRALVKHVRASAHPATVLPQGTSREALATSE